MCQIQSAPELPFHGGQIQSRTQNGLFSCCIHILADKAANGPEIHDGLDILDTEYAVEDYAIAVKKGNTALLDDINAALEALTEDGTIDAIIGKYIKAE